MKGFPKSLSSKEDYIYIKDNFPSDEWKPEWQLLLDSRMDWFNTGEVKKSKGKTDETHKVIEVDPMEEGGTTIYYQYELKENPTCKLLQLGFTVEEVEEALAE